MNTFLVYTLHDPCEPTHMRYVGYTSRTLAYRLKRHLVNASKSHKTYWVRQLLREGRQPVITLIATTPSLEAAHAAERECILTYRAKGHDLTNATAGGEGATGYRHTPEALVKMRGRTFTAEHRAKQAAAAYRRSPETLARIKAAADRVNVGRVWSPETLAKMSAAQKGRKLSPERCLQRSVSATGIKQSEAAKAKRRAAHERRQLCGGLSPLN
jgi:hypothetical protein